MHVNGIFKLETCYLFSLAGFNFSAVATNAAAAVAFGGLFSCTRTFLSFRHMLSLSDFYVLTLVRC